MPDEPTPPEAITVVDPTVPAVVEQKEPPKGEHIFHATELTKLAVQWKKLNAEERHGEAMEVLEKIVIGSTAMFERLAQHENFTYTVELPVLVSAASEKVVRWLQAWQPKKGPLFSWFSKCAKNAFRSEVVKVSQYRKRFHVTGDNLEKFYGLDDHEINKQDLASDVHKKLREITSRWGHHQEIGCIRYLLECVIEDEHDKQAAIASAAFCWGVSPELAKFFYTWVLVSMRDALYEKSYLRLTEQDLFRASQSYSHIVDLLNFMTWDQVKRLIATRGGMRLKIPTLAQLAKMKESYELFREIDLGDKDPDSVASVGRKRKKSVRTAQETYFEMCEQLNPMRSGEYELYDDQ